jgi:hypothetical protein
MDESVKEHLRPVPAADPTEKWIQYAVGILR